MMSSSIRISLAETTKEVDITDEIREIIARESNSRNTSASIGICSNPFRVTLTIRPFMRVAGASIDRGSNANN